ncbi:hypothetical protein BASA50_004902 [Batrachochytrium salamandrivorans]|uniref:Uncharacterized protein n=1 Tax=Batrachochytrium salamandrivorans TaxID=1357716 RepID=A0ABQ8FER9_9FUNG|nr:hypothetical protein BASA62_006616 [Batrachochytrium salamandrivorans]KAH6577869.1 hypothetical protein BASA60_003843 [Batrachochytrium salamandrivorans]KAH6580218.1 hypothetical protein BASA61_009774 [Batrachochytrium salamandrivorans]KAH6596797.1 hypothetical protein BASA50_004902 [Batrachochytrium salamandrivorans]KAH9264067.1 hypothetical protein BASA83_012465 [Batrachochytrium salamandrivorans]
MQLFYLFSFVVVASYAAALPQPAELSEQYSNNADATLAYDLEARSYQSVFNSQGDSATLVSLKRRDNSEGSSGDNGGSGSSPPPVTTFQERARKAFTKDEISPMNLASTIDKVGDGMYIFFERGERVGKKIGGRVGQMVAKYIRRAIYVVFALINWARSSSTETLLTIRSGLGNYDYTAFLPEFTEMAKKSDNDFRGGVKATIDGISNILKNVGSDIENVQKIHRSFEDIFYNRTSLIYKLRDVLGRFTTGKTLQGYLADISRSIGRFLAGQHHLHLAIIREFNAASSQ